MDQYDYLTRDQLISLIRVLGTERGEGARGQAPGAADGLSEFGARALREFENSSSPMRIFDHETLKHLAVNDAAVKFYGYSREEFLALTLKDTRHPDEHDLQLASLNEASGYLRYGKPRRQLKKSGEIAVVEVVTQDILYNGRKARLTLTIDITGRLRMQELLWRRQQEFESLANNLPDLVARYDRDRRFLYANSAIERSFGLDRAQIVGRTQREIGLPEELASLYDDSLTGVFATGQPHKVEFRLALPSGERQYEACHVAEMDAAGEIGSVICVARDITDSKRSEQALRESNEFLRSVIESSRDCIKVLDLEGRLKLMNDGGRLLLEIDNLAPLLNTEWLEFWRGAGHAAAGAALDAARRGGVGSFEGYCPTQKGSPRWWDVVVTPILDADGKPERLLAVSRDITNRKRARDMQSRLAAIVNHSMDSVISTDLDGIIRTWNPAAEHLFGYRADEAVGQSVQMLIPPDRREEEALVRERIRNGVPVEPFESVRCMKGGTLIDVSLSVSPIKDVVGQVIGVSRIARDITERRQSELAVLRSTALTQLFESLARAANEALTPEAAMVACLGLICRHGRWVLGRVEMFDRVRPKEAPGRSVWHAPEGNRFHEFIRITEDHTRMESGPFIGRVLRERTAVWIEDWRQKAGYRRWAAATSHGLRSAFAFPIIAGGEVVAIMEVFSEEARPQDPHIMGAAQSIASQLARIVEREWAHQADARMAAIVGSSQDAIVSRTLEGTILTWNPGAEKLLGYTASEIVGRNIEILWPPELTTDMRRRQALLAHGLAGPAYETVRVAKDGRRVHVSTSPMPVRDSSGNICGVSTIIQDITERKLAEHERLAHAVEQRDALVREVHHRIKNSLQGVVGLLRQKIRKNPAITPDIEECIAQLQSVALVYGLQETRPDGLLNLAEITDAICSSACNLIGGRLERIFERQSQGPACVAGTQAVSVAVALNELVINALKHQPARAGKKHVRIVLRETDDEAEIRIANRGHLPAGFDYHGGRAAGNGLELVRTLLAAPGGTITFNGARDEVEVVLKLSPPLLAERQGTLRGKR